MRSRLLVSRRSLALQTWACRPVKSHKQSAVLAIACRHLRVQGGLETGPAYMSSGGCQANFMLNIGYRKLGLPCLCSPMLLQGANKLIQLPGSCGRDAGSKPGGEVPKFIGQSAAPRCEAEELGRPRPRASEPGRPTSAARRCGDSHSCDARGRVGNSRNAAAHGVAPRQGDGFSGACPSTPSRFSNQDRARPRSRED